MNSQEENRQKTCQGLKNQQIFIIGDILDFTKILAKIQHGTEEIIPKEELIAKLKKSEETGKPLRIKLGCDPSRPDLHIGHAVVLRKLRDFQDLGHEAILVVGDFTAMIGDPSGKSKTRPQLTAEETKRNGETYFEQARKILDPEKTRIVYNSEWLGAMKFADVIKLASKFTVARMLERDDFEKRYQAGDSIGVHEFLYPLAQAMDSVALEADIELGGTDQKFNLLVGRHIQRYYDQEPQVIITMPILEGTDGVEKMSKSLGNHVALADSPNEMFGKLMSIPDELILKYFQLAVFADKSKLADIKEKLASQSVNPMVLKKEMARKVIEFYHSEEEAIKAQEEFERVFSKGDIPADLPIYTPEQNRMWIVKFVADSGLVKSNGEARRMIKQGAVSIDGEKITLTDLEVIPKDGMILKIGKRRFCKVKL